MGKNKQLTQSGWHNCPSWHKLARLDILWAMPPSAALIPLPLLTQVCLSGWFMGDATLRCFNTIASPDRLAHLDILWVTPPHAALSPLPLLTQACLSGCFMGDITLYCLTACVQDQQERCHLREQWALHSPAHRTAWSSSRQKVTIFMPVYSRREWMLGRFGPVWLPFVVGQLGRKACTVRCTFMFICACAHDVLRFWSCCCYWWVCDPCVIVVRYLLWFWFMWTDWFESNSCLDMDCDRMWFRSFWTAASRIMILMGCDWYDFDD